MKKSQKMIKVSDWSQKWKLLVYAIVVFGFAIFVWFAVLPWAAQVLQLLQEIARNTA